MQSFQQTSFSFLQKQQTLVSLNKYFGRYCFKLQNVPACKPLKMEIEYDNHITWLEAAEELRISSEVLKRELINSTEAENNSETLAFFNSYMLLLGFHFENYLKGKSLEIYKLSTGYSTPISFDNLKKI